MNLFPKFVLMLIISSFLISCSSPETTSSGLKVMDSMGASPSWLLNHFDANQPEKGYTFIGYGESRFKDTAREIASLNSASAFASVIAAAVVDNQDVKSMKTRRANVSGMRRSAIWWRWSTKGSFKKGKLHGWKRPSYEYYIRYTVPFRTVRSRITESFIKEYQSVELNEGQKSFYKWLISYLKNSSTPKTLRPSVTVPFSLLNYAGEEPAWLSQTQNTLGAKGYYFIGKGQSIYKGTAADLAELNCFARVFFVMKNGLLDKLKGISAQGSEYESQLTALIAQIEKSYSGKLFGLLPANQWWQFVQASKPENPVYEVYKRYFIHKKLFAMTQKLLVKNAVTQMSDEKQGETGDENKVKIKLNNIGFAAANNLKPELMAELKKVESKTITKKTKTALSFAMDKGHIEIVKLLLESGASIDDTDKHGNTVLEWAIQKRNLPLLKQLVEKGADLSKISSKIARPFLLDAVAEKAKSESELLEFLLKQKINTRFDNGEGSLLHWAIQKKNKELIEMLLDNEVEVNAVSANGNSPLLLAIGQSDFELAKTLIDKDADSSIKNNQGWTAAHYAAQKGNTEIAEILLDKKADWKTKNNAGESPLDLALKNQQAQMVLLLVEKDLVDKEFYSKILFFATSHKKMELLSALKDQKVDLNQKNADGKTPLMIASAQGNKEVTKWLLENGASLSKAKKGEVSSKPEAGMKEEKPE